MGMGCGKSPCRDLMKVVCEKAPDTLACRTTSRLTTDEECAAYLKDVNRYVELTNQVVDKPGVKPPAPPAPAPAPAPAPVPVPVPAPEKPVEAPSAEPAPEGKPSQDKVETPATPADKGETKPQ